MKYLSNLRATSKYRLDIIIGLGFHLLLFISFIIAFSFAAVNVKAEENSCLGKNFIDELSADALAEARKNADLIPNGSGLLWKVEKEGLEPSWLFGTMHVTDPRVLNLPEDASKALDRANTVVIETLDLLDPTKTQAAVLMNPDLTMFTDGSTLTSNMNEEDAAFVEEELKSRGISIGLIAKMKPWMVMSLVGASDCETERKASGTKILDFEIIEQAKNDGKTIKGLETITEQLSAMASIPVDFQVRGLLETLRLGDLNNDVIETMISLYVAQDIGMIKPAIKAIATELGQDKIDEEGFGDFEARIVTERNYLMAERSEPILAEGSAFVAVGALHLPGEEGLIELLRKRGFTISRVN